MLLLELVLVAAAAVLPASAQKHKVPVLDKIGSSPSRQAFSGKVLSLDAERNLLNVNTVQGSGTEIFSVKKARVVTADGEKLKLSALTPGTDVIIYYEQKDDQRSVKDIVILGPGPGEPKKASPPS
jgi:hypothetical protein